MCERERVCMEVVRGSLSSSPNIPAALEKTGWVTSGYISWRLTHAWKLRRTKDSIVISSLEDLEPSLTLNRSAQQTPSSGFRLSPSPTPYLILSKQRALTVPQHLLQLSLSSLLFYWQIWLNNEFMLPVGVAPSACKSSHVLWHRLRRASSVTRGVTKDSVDLGINRSMSTFTQILNIRKGWNFVFKSVSKQIWKDMPLESHGCSLKPQKGHPGLKATPWALELQANAVCLCSLHANHKETATLSTVWNSLTLLCSHKPGWNHNILLARGRPLYALEGWRLTPLPLVSLFEPISWHSPYKSRRAFATRLLVGVSTGRVHWKIPLSFPCYRRP